jgi:hypothetical protein
MPCYCPVPYMFQQPQSLQMLLLNCLQVPITHCEFFFLRFPILNFLSSRSEHSIWLRIHSVSGNIPLRGICTLNLSQNKYRLRHINTGKTKNERTREHLGRILKLYDNTRMGAGKEEPGVYPACKFFVIDIQRMQRTRFVSSMDWN